MGNVETELANWSNGIKNNYIVYINYFQFYLVEYTVHMFTLFN